MSGQLFSPLTDESGARVNRISVGALALIVAATLAICIWLIESNPVIYWYDSYMRLALRDHLFVSPWLPVVQIAVFTISRLTFDLAGFRIVWAVISALTLICVYLFASQTFNSRAAGLIAVLLIATNQMFLALATVPYTEIIFIGLLLLGLYFYDRSDRRTDQIAGLVALNLACLTRYEGWALAAILAAEKFIFSLRRDGFRHALRRSLVTLVALSWFVPIWLIVGTVQMYTAEAESASVQGQIAVLASMNEFFNMLGWQAGGVIIALSLIGAAFALASQRIRWLVIRVIALLAINFPLEVLINPFNLRQTYIYLNFILIFAAFGLERLAHGLIALMRLQERAAQIVRVGALSMVVGVLSFSALAFSLRFVAETSNQRLYQSVYEVGRWCKEHPETPAPRLLVLTDDVSVPYMLSVYSGIPVENFIVPSADTLEPDGEKASYVIALNVPGTILPPAAQDLQRNLHAGSIPGSEVKVGAAQIWVLDGADSEKQPEQ